MKKKGSALITTILILSILFTLSVVVAEMSIASFKKSITYYNRNISFYSSENIIGNVMFLIEKLAEDAREEANKYCFTASGAPNLQNHDIQLVYDEYISSEKSTDDKEKFKNEIKKIFMRKYKDYIYSFLHENSDKTISFRDEISGNQIILNNWNEIKEFVKDRFKEEAIVSFELFSDAKNDSELVKIVDGVEESKFFYHDSEDFEKYDFDTLIFKINYPKRKITKYYVVSFEFNPFNKNLNEDLFSEKKIRRGYNHVLDYALLSGRNLFVVNGEKWFKINGDIYVKGTGNHLNENKGYEDFGGIVVGISDPSDVERLKYATFNHEDDALTLNKRSGNLKVNGDLFLGNFVLNEGAEDAIENYKMNSGFLKVLGENSNVEINGNAYCHSIVTGEDANNSKINISQNAYIADNVSLYAKGSRVNINGNLIGFETADSNVCFNESSSIVINDETADLSIGGNIILLGVAFVDDLINKNTNNVFKTYETAAVYPNFLIYEYDIDKVEGENNLNWKPSNEDYDTYYLREDKDVELRMLSREKISQREGEANSIKKGINYFIHYAALNKVLPGIYDYTLNLGSNFRWLSPISGTQHNNNYFTGIITSNDKIYMMDYTNSILEDEASLKNILGGQLSVFKGDLGAIRVRTIEDILKPLKIKLYNYIKFRSFKTLDNGIKNANEFWDYVNFESLKTDIFIKNSEKKILIYISKENINLNLDEYDGYSVLIVSKSDVKLSSTKDIKITGNIIAKKSIIIDGEIELNYDKEKSKALMNYYDLREYDKCIAMYKFFARGITLDDYTQYDMPAGFLETKGKNLKIKLKKQFIK